MTLDDIFDEDNDVKTDVDGMVVVIDRNLQDTLENATISCDPEKGLVVLCEPS